MNEFARALVAAILCMTPDDDGQACGQCDECRWSSAGTHPDQLSVGDLYPRADEEDPDAREVSPDRGDGEGVLKIERIREATTFLSVAPNRNHAKVVVISPADRLTLAASNALLKVLEEPPARCHLILVTAVPSRLPLTVRSRCVQVRLPVPSMTDARDWLAQQDIEAPELALAQTGNAPLAARDLPPEYWTARQRLLPLLAHSSRAGNLGACLAAATDIDHPMLVRLVQTWCCDLAYVKLGDGRSRFHPDLESEARECARRVGTAALFGLASRLQTSRRWLDHPMNPKLANEEILLAYHAMYSEI
ncbi:MAG: hypothetical protein GC151_13110 [Betaproteobacteria bacterium]|nr:hypothetical protein [Betaproteobacteria bacterium]